MGRPAFEITEDVLKRVEAHASQGLTKKQIARTLGICYDTLNEKQKEYPEFSEAIKRGQAKGIAKVSNALFQRAVGYSHSDTKIMQHQGKVITHTYTKHFPPDTTAQIFFLKNRSPEEWKDRHNHEHTGADGGPIKSITAEMTPQEAAEAYQDTLKNKTGEDE